MNIRLEGDWGNQLNHLLPGSTNPTLTINATMYDRLVGVTTDGKTLVPYVASSWTINSPTSVTFTIRQGITCSDGTPFDAAAVANDLQHVIDPSYHANQSYRLLGGDDGGPYSVTADPTANTVTLTSGPNSQMVPNLALPHIALICPAGFAPGADFSKQSYGTGEFVLDSVTSDSVRVKRRPDWNWGPNGTTANDPGVPDTITFKVVQNTTTAANQLQTGELDLAPIRGPDVLRLRQDPALNESVAYSTTLAYMTMNEDPTRVTSDKQVRQALSTAIDPKAWNQAANNGEGGPGTSILSSNFPCYDPNTANLLPNPPGDVNKARDILLADGYSQGADGKLAKDGKPLHLEVLTTSLLSSGPEYVAEQFNQMGADAVVVPSDNTNLSNDGKFDVSFYAGANVLPSTGFALGVVSGPDPPVGGNAARIHDPVNEDLLLKAKADPTCQGWYAWQDHLLTDYHILPLNTLKYSWFGRNTAPVFIMSAYADASTFRWTR
ncbi:MAG: ABC transporter substrate-binding protein [Chloroflexi bacterium]|nr:ABC transporter substrate-binding protein [Chloroflexota bacterium]